jgi:hypothetical protein
MLRFIAFSNIFIALCAASLSAYSQSIFNQHIRIEQVTLTFCATFLLYNAQRLFLSWLSKSHQKQDWYRKHTPLLALFMLLAMLGLYPLVHSSLRNLSLYAISLIIGFLYFLPVSNLRKLPFLKSLSVGIVWGLVCVAACIDNSLFNFKILAFFCAQVFLVTALCILFNIRDLVHDTALGTRTLPVVWGLRKAKLVTHILLLGYLVCHFSLTAAAIFILGCFLTQQARPENHAFYYLYAVDGLILLQSMIEFGWRFVCPTPFVFIVSYAPLLKKFIELF